MEIILYHPETPEKQALLGLAAARCHAEYVAQYIRRLNCSALQKQKLIDAVAQTISDSCRGAEETEAVGIG